MIELIVAITLLGLLVALSLPTFTTWIRNSQVRTVAEALQDGLRTAQAEAVRRNQQVVMSFTNDPNPQLDPETVVGGKNWSLQTVRSAFVTDLEGNQTVEFIRSGVLADVASASDVNISICPRIGAVRFSANGRLVTDPNPSAVSTSTYTCAAPAAAGAVCAARTVCFRVNQTNADRPLQVNVTLGGQVRMCDPNRPALSSTSPDGCSP